MAKAHNNNSESSTQAPPISSKKNLSTLARNKIAQFCFQHSSNGQLHRGMITLAAAKFRLTKKSISKIWKEAKSQIEEGVPINLINKKVGLSRKTKCNFDGDKLKAVHVSSRGTVRGLAQGLGVSVSTTWRWVQTGKIRCHSNSIKPELSAKCKIARLKFCVSALFKQNLNQWQYICMKHVVHIDEKWFYLTRTSERYYLEKDEVEPYRSCKSKKHITKIMFLCAVSRSIYNIDGSLIFDGKIDMFPFIEKVAAKRRSKNRPAGTLETKAIESVTKDVIKSCLINQVIPAIKAKCPLTENTDIFIQQDNAKPHINDSDIEFRTAASTDGFNIHLICQPPSSPDLNVNDLGWFRALQTKRASYNVDELVDAVLQSYKNLDHVKLNNVFLSLQAHKTEILKVKGHNNYRQPHLNKSAMIREGRLPENLVVEDELVKECIQYLLDAGETEGFESLVQYFEEN